MRVLNLTQSISRNAGGLAPAVLESVSAQCSMGINGYIATIHDANTLEDIQKYIVPLDVAKFIGPKIFGYSPDLKRKVFSQKPPDIIHSHSLWTYQSYLALCFSKERNIPLIVSPHGTLTPFAWSHNQWKKRLAWWLWECRKMERTAVIVASAEMEFEDLRKFGVRCPIAVIPLGLHLPSVNHPKNIRQNQRVALFLSRIHPVKGLLMLVDAIRQLKPSGWKFIIAGPNENGHEEEVKAVIQSLGLHAYFEFPGPVYGQDKWGLYRSADLFILPSYTENFGIVIAEALASETAVITTNKTPWKDLEAQNCGWWVEPTADAIAKALNEAVALPPSSLVQMGKNGRVLIESNYTWQESARKTIVLYEWLLGKGEQPSFVHTE